MGASQVEEPNTQSQKLYTCEHCQMTFLRPVHLERHMRNVHSQEQESECNVCHKLFQNKYYLSVHMLTHAMDKELECPLCKKRFSDVNSLNKHKDAHLGIGLNNPANPANPANSANSANNNVSYMQGTNLQLNKQFGAGNAANPTISATGSGPTTSTYSGAGRGNTFNCDLRLTDLNSLNRSARNYRGGQHVAQAASNKNSTVSCDLRLGDINSLNQSATNSIRLPQKRPSNDDKDVIVTGVSSLKRPYRIQGLSTTNTSRNQVSNYGSSLISTANKTPITNLSQSSSRNNFLQNQLRTQNSTNSGMTNRNVTDRIYLTSEGMSSQSTVRNSLPARITYSNRKQLANHLTQNNRFGNNSIYSNLVNQRNQLLRNSNQANQRSVVNCDLTRSNLGTINRRTGLPYNKTSQQFSNGTKESDATVNCDLTISNISSLNKNQWPTHNSSSSRISQSIPLRNYGLSTRPVSTVNFDLTTTDINVLKRNRRLRQAGRMLAPGTSASGQTPNTLNCDLSMADLSSIEKNRQTLNNGNRFGRLNPHVITNQNPQLAQNTVNCDLTTNNLNDWNRRNTICYRANNQSILQQNNRQPTRALNCNLTNVNLSNLNQRAVNNTAGGRSTQQQIRPVQIYANTSHPAVLLRQKNAAALSNRSSNFGVQPSNNVLRARTFPRRTAGLSQPVSTINSFNRSRMSRMFRQRKTLAPSNVPVIDLDPDDDVSVVSKRPTLPTNSTNIVQFDLTGPDVNVTTYENGSSSYSGKQPSVNVVDIVELGTRNNSTSQPASNNAASVVEFDLSNTSIQAFSTGQNEPSSTCTINLDTDDWSSNSRNITTNNNTSSDVTLLEVRTLNKPAKEVNQAMPDITLSDVRSLSTLQSSVPADDRSSVSGITLVDIRSLSTSEIDANFHNDPETSKTKASSGNLPSKSSSLAPDSSRSPPLVLDNVMTVDLCSIDVDNAEENVITDSVSSSVDQASNVVELKEDYFTCKICLEQIHHLCNYISHLKCHNSKEFCKCYYCDSVFGNIQELVVHSVVHVGDLKKQCVFCREVLASGEDPITHMTGCGEFQCIMFESGTRVKIEKNYQKETEQDEEDESTAQNESDQNKETQSTAQSQIDQGGEAKIVTPTKTDQDGKAEIVAQSQIDQDDESESATKSQKDPDGNRKSDTQSQKDPDGNRKSDTQSQKDPDGNRKSDTQSQKDPDGNRKSDTQSQKDPDGNRKSDAQSQKDPDGNRKSDTQSQKDPDGETESATENKMDQDDETESATQSQKDPDGNTKSATQCQMDQDDETESAAQNKTDQDGKTEIVAQSQIDQNEETENAAPNSLDHDYKENKSVVQSKIDQNGETQNQADEDCHMRNAAQNQIDQEHNEQNERVAQSLDQTRKTENVVQSQNDEIKVAAPNQFDPDEKSECASQEELPGSLSQNLLEEIGQDELRECDQTEFTQDKKEGKSQDTHEDEAENKIIKEMTKVADKNKDQNIKEEKAEKVDENESEKASKAEDKVPGELAESQTLEKTKMSDMEETEQYKKEAEELVRESVDMEENKELHPCLEKSYPSMDKAENIDFSADESEKSDMTLPSLDEVEKMEVCSDQTKSQAPCLDEFKKVDLPLDVTEKSGSCPDEAKKADPYLDETKKADSYHEVAKNLHPSSDETEKPDLCQEIVKKSTPLSDAVEKTDICLDENKEVDPSDPNPEEVEQMNPILKEVKKVDSFLDQAEMTDLIFKEAEKSNPDCDETNKSNRAFKEAEIFDEEKSEEMTKQNEEKMEIEDQCNAIDDNLPVSETNLELVDRNEKKMFEENITCVKTEINSEEMTQENTTGELLEQEISEQTDAESSSLIKKENLNDMETGHVRVKMEEGERNDDYSTSWCKWERDMILNSKFKNSVVRNLKVEINTDMEVECQKEIEFEVDLDKIKKEASDTKDTLDKS